MSLAHKLAYSQTIDGSAARALPEVERAPRPERKPSPAPRARRRVLFGVFACGWLVVMAFCIMLVHMNSMVSAELASITQARKDLSMLQQQNQELKAQLVTANSVTAVEQWAAGKGMKRPATVGKLKGDPSAVANRPAPGGAAYPPSESAGERAAESIWGALKSLVAKMSDTLQFVGASVR